MTPKIPTSTLAGLARVGELPTELPLSRAEFPGAALEQVARTYPGALKVAGGRLVFAAVGPAAHYLLRSALQRLYSAAK